MGPYFTEKSVPDGTYLRGSKFNLTVPKHVHYVMQINQASQRCLDTRLRRFECDIFEYTYHIIHSEGIYISSIYSSTHIIISSTLKAYTPKVSTNNFSDKRSARYTPCHASVISKAFSVLAQYCTCSVTKNGIQHGSERYR